MSHPDADQISEVVRALLVEDGITPDEFDESMSFSLDGLTSGRVEMTDEVAKELSEFFGTLPRFWLERWWKS